MPVNYFNKGSPSGLDINEVLEEVEYQLISDKVSKLSDPSGGKVLVSTIGGDMRESESTESDIDDKIRKITNPTGGAILESLSDGTIKESTLRVEHVSSTFTVLLNARREMQGDIYDLQSSQMHHDMGYVPDFQGSNEQLVLPVDLVATRPMQIIAASVVMKFKDDSELTKQSKILKIYTKTSTQRGHAEYPLTPNDSRAVSISCSHILQQGHRYNAGLKFMFPSHSELLEHAAVKLYYKFV